MKYSFCSIAFREQKVTLGELVSFLSKVGYQGIEFWANHLDNSVDLGALKSLLKENKLEVPMICPYFDLTSSASKWNQSLETAKAFIEKASLLEAPLIRAFTGIVGSKEATDKQRKDCVEGLKRICEMAQEANIEIALETHPSTLVDNVQSTIALIQEVGMTNLKVNLDIYHMFEVHKDPLMVLDMLFPYVAHVHAKNATIKPFEKDEAKHPLLHDPNPGATFIGVRSLGDGEMSYEPFIESLIEKGYEGYVSVEWFGVDPFNAAISELKYLTKVAAKRIAHEQETLTL